MTNNQDTWLLNLSSEDIVELEAAAHHYLLLGRDIGEISAVISEEIFEYLDAPVIRVGSLDTPVPFAKNLEEGFQASYKLKDKLDYLLNY